MVPKKIGSDQVLSALTLDFWTSELGLTICHMSRIIFMNGKIEKGKMHLNPS